MEDSARPYSMYVGYSKHACVCGGGGAEERYGDFDEGFYKHNVPCSSGLHVAGL